MAIARFLELCLDTTREDTVVAEFWAAATGCRFATNPWVGAVVGPEEGMGIAICPVPETRTVKNRVHLDLHTDSIETLVTLGATVLPDQDDEDRWTVMGDPEGNELCAFVRSPDRLATYRAYELVVDSADPVRIGGWWAEVFGAELKHEEGTDWTWLEGVPGFPMEAWVFGAVPEPKTVKNRMHWDLYGDVAEFEARGATRLWSMPRWTVMGDPEGNEFCVFPEG